MFTQDLTEASREAMAMLKCALCCLLSTDCQQSACLVPVIFLPPVTCCHISDMWPCVLARFAYQVRCWQLQGHGVMSHAQLVGELAAPLRVLLQPAGSADKKLVTLAHNNYVAELRAEVHAYWRQCQQQCQQQGQRPGGPAGDGLAGAAEPAQLRIISQGTELTPDCDDKLLTDVGFKDMQVRAMGRSGVRRWNGDCYGIACDVTFAGPREA